MRPALLSAFRNTCYEAAGTKIRVGQRSVAMDRMLLAYGSQTATFITAYNPLSRKMPSGWNQRMQMQLLQAVRRRPVLFGTGSLGRWSEAHLLVFGDPRPVLRLARRYRQHGIVIVHRRRAARLVITCQPKTS
jgi:Protein of unknown function (DUF3293)